MVSSQPAVSHKTRATNTHNFEFDKHDTNTIHVHVKRLAQIIRELKAN